MVNEFYISILRWVCFRHILINFRKRNHYIEMWTRPGNILKETKPESLRDENVKYLRKIHHEHVCFLIFMKVISLFKT